MDLKTGFAESAATSGGRWPGLAMFVGLLLSGCGIGGSGDTALVTVPTAHLSIALPAQSVIAGRQYTFSVTASDANNLAVPSYTGSVRIATSDASAALPADATLSRGTGAFSVTFRSPGTQTITASDTAGNAVAVTSASIDVTRARLAIDAEASSVVAGLPLSISVSVLDANNGVDPGFAGTVHFAATDNSAQLPADSTLNGGKRFYHVTFNSPGAHTITVSDLTGSADSATSIAIDVTPPQNPVPSIQYLTPGCSRRGEFDSMGLRGPNVQVYGSKFVPDSVVRWNGSDRPTRYGSEGVLIVTLADGDITQSAHNAVTVFNPAPGGGTSEARDFFVAAGASRPLNIALAPGGRFAYVSFNGCEQDGFGFVATYSIDSTSGMLSPVGSPIPVLDYGLRDMKLSPDGRHLYVASWGVAETTGSIVNFNVDTDSGALTRGSTWDGKCSPGCALAPWSIDLTPDGRFLYSAHHHSDQILGSSIAGFSLHAATGDPTLMQALPMTGLAMQVIAHPSGQLLFSLSCRLTVFLVCSTEPGGTELSTYRVTTAGDLNRLGSTSLQPHASRVTLNPSGTFAYVAAPGAGTLAVYAIDTGTGILTLRQTMQTGTEPSGLKFSPSGEFAYMGTTDSPEGLSVYRADATLGLLTRIGHADGIAPGDMAFDPASRWVYITNTEGNEIQICSIDPDTGMLTLVGSITT